MRKKGSLAEPAEPAAEQQGIREEEADDVPFLSQAARKGTVVFCARSKSTGRPVLGHSREAVEGGTGGVRSVTGPKSEQIRPPRGIVENLTTWDSLHGKGVTAFGADERPVGHRLEAVTFS